jgi:hypothetical protein
MLCDICVGVIQHRRGMKTTCTRLNGKLERHRGNLGDNLENPQNLVFFRSSHHLTFDTLTDSVGKGCRICRSFWKDLSESRRDSMRDLNVTAENESLTDMLIKSTIDCDYAITILASNPLMIWCAYSLEPGQCSS